MPVIDEPLTLLGGISPGEFLRHYWQKKPLLIRQAIPHFSGLLTADELAGLACEEDVYSRIVIQTDNQWQLKDGPFDEAYFSQLPEKDWTLLVQSVNHLLPEASALLQQFNFIPRARLDDLMISYAADGGSVGPHFDSYDVFLLQGSGKRLWQISDQTDLTLVENSHLKILKTFSANQSWLLEAGDMLYLPPKFAHWGIAQPSDEAPCMTYSVGFRAPTQQELATEFLGFLQDQYSQSIKQLAGLYEDPELTLQNNTAEISTETITKVSNYLRAILWNNDDVSEFIGQYLTEPNQDIVFVPNKKMKLAQFIQHMQSNDLALDLKSKLLFHQNSFYMNGEAFTLDNLALEIIHGLANDRIIIAGTITQLSAANSMVAQTLYDWYLAGYCHFE